jgi:hypothetical protein
MPPLVTGQPKDCLVLLHPDREEAQETENAESCQGPERASKHRILQGWGAT